MLVLAVPLLARDLVRLLDERTAEALCPSEVLERWWDHTLRLDRIGANQSPPVVRAPNGEMLVWQHAAPERFVPKPVRAELVNGEHFVVLAGLAYLPARILTQEMSKIGAFNPLMFGMGVTMIGPTIMDYGTEAQKAEHLPRIAVQEHEAGIGEHRAQERDPQHRVQVPRDRVRIARDGAEGGGHRLRQGGAGKKHGGRRQRAKTGAASQ